MSILFFFVGDSSNSLSFFLRIQNSLNSVRPPEYDNTQRDVGFTFEPRIVRVRRLTMEEDSRNDFFIETLLRISKDWYLGRKNKGGFQ